ncbi:MAG: bacteriophage holin [Candidatus Thioglobus sp.]|uniref:bacteriophage holin n=1 Tax=Candidatus Thioglobus sp. TaxID=2026721 RepID=UPI0026181A12|nr:bacteriophage holin [Candidatus Thioglobus sp.]MDC9726847.1 bacteriophage holin [Candidatus Thioglobus sp.]
MTQKLDTKAVALALGIMWSLGVFFMSITAIVTQSYLHNIVDFLSTVYLGYSLSFSGIVTGMVWGFFDAAIGGLVFAWLYNKLAK